MGNKGKERSPFPKPGAESLSGLTLLVVVKGDKRTTYDLIVEGEVVGQVRTGKQAIIGRDEVTQETVVIPYDKSHAMATEGLSRIPIRDITKLGG